MTLPDTEAASLDLEKLMAIRRAYLLAKKSFEVQRPMTRAEQGRLAKTLFELASRGCLQPDRLATRAIVRML